MVITSRHGSKHLGYARPYLEKGIPVWVDKPIASNVSDALEMVALAKQNGTTVSCDSVQMMLDEFFEIVKTGHNPQDPTDWIAPVVLVDATIRAYESGEWVECRSEDACLL